MPITLKIICPKDASQDLENLICSLIESAEKNIDVRKLIVDKTDFVKGEATIFIREES